MRLCKKDIIESCKDIDGLSFKEGRFKGGTKYMLTLEAFGRTLSWKCKTLKDCAEALVQADFMLNVVL